jgi:NAD(P)-dependent dehydrogenase (short-subunit alcohol dehydrogenase family)
MSQTIPFRLDGKTALVTGGASGIGASVARVFAAAGARLILADLDLDAANRLAAELGNGSIGLQTFW